MECPNCKKPMTINFLDLNFFLKLPCHFCKEYFRPNFLTSLFHILCWFFSLTTVFFILVKFFGVVFPNSGGGLLLKPLEYLPEDKHTVLILIGAGISSLLHFCLFYFVFQRFGKLEISKTNLPFNHKFVMNFILLFLGIGYVGLTIEFAFLILIKVFHVQ